MKRKYLLSTIAAVLAGLTTACAVVKEGAKGTPIGDAAETIDDASKPMSLNDERDIGETLSLQAYATEGFGKPIKNKKLMKWMNTMLAALSRNSDRPLIPFFIAVIDSDKINAFATPGGYVFITKGSIEIMKSEAELACVLGHEISHVTERHAIDTIQRTKKIGAVAKLAGSEDFDKLIKELCSKLLNNAFDRDKEIGADIHGIEVAYRTGYDPRAMLEFLDSVESHPGMLSSVTSSHPKPEDRKAEINKWLSSREFSGCVKDTARFAQVKAWLKEPQESW